MLDLLNLVELNLVMALKSKFSTRVLNLVQHSSTAVCAKFTRRGRLERGKRIPVLTVVTGRSGTRESEVIYAFL